MSELIWKIEIPASGSSSIEIPHMGEILWVAGQGDFVYMWVKFPEEYKERLDVRDFEIYGTGDTIPGGVNRKFIGTVQLYSGSLVFHIFEKV